MSNKLEEREASVQPLESSPLILLTDAFTNNERNSPSNIKAIQQNDTAALVKDGTIPQVDIVDGQSKSSGVVNTQEQLETDKGKKEPKTLEFLDFTKMDPYELPKPPKVQGEDNDSEHGKGHYSEKAADRQDQTTAPGKVDDDPADRTKVPATGAGVYPTGDELKNDRKVIPEGRSKMDGPVAGDNGKWPTEVPEVPEVPRTPEQLQIAEYSKALDIAFENDPNKAQVAADKSAFLERTDITDKQKADALKELVDTVSRKFDEGNRYRSMMSEPNILRAVAGGINDIAKPRSIDQGNNGTCNATAIQEGVAFARPERYTAQLREATLHATYTGNDGFRAVIPASMLQPHQGAMLPQNTDNARNFSSQLIQGGMLNHLHQQGSGHEGTKQYYTDSDAGGEQRYQFDPNAQNPYTVNFVGSGANIFINQLGFMGRNLGIQGQFVLAREDFMTREQIQHLDPSVKLVGSAQELADAKANRQRGVNGAFGHAGEWSMAVVNSNNGFFTGQNQSAHGGNPTGHAVSTYANGDLSNQWGSQFDRTGISNIALFDTMDRTIPRVEPIPRVIVRHPKPRHEERAQRMSQTSR